LNKPETTPSPDSTTSATAPTHKQQDHFDRAAYRRRHKIENMWAKLKEWRPVATRYDKTATSFSGGLYLAAAFQWSS
jgi:transposase